VCVFVWPAVASVLTLHALLPCIASQRALGTHISRVRSIKMDSWTNEQLELMRGGGNYACRRFLERHSTEIGFDFYNTPIQQKYTTPAAEEYKKQLQRRATKGGKADETESSTETGENSNVSAAPSSSIGLERNKYKKQLRTASSMDESVCSFAEDDSNDAAPGAKKIRDTSNKETTGMDDSEGAIDEGEEEEEDDDSERNKGVGAAMKSRSLDAWFNKKTTGGDRRMSALPIPASDASVSAGSTATSSIQSAISSLTGRKKVRRHHSSASAPTITYMGRSFSADGSDDANKLISQRESAKIRGQSDVKLLAEMAATQDEIASEKLGAAWRQTAWKQSAPTQMQWTADKKIEPFNLNDGSGGLGGSYNGPSHRRGGRRPSRHESLRKKLAYTDADLLKIAQDDNEFRRLKAGLKNKGAVTNEVLKQRLYAFVAKSKLRHSDSNASGESAEHGDDCTAGPTSRRGKLQATKSEDLTSFRRAHTIHTNTANRR
jgi:Putative GTPase activating protein for Arf